MHVRPVCWVMCGASATLLTSAWGGMEVDLPVQNQNVFAASAVIQTNSGMRQEDTKKTLLVKPHTRAKKKSEPFSKVISVKQNAVASTAVKLASHQPAIFPYVFVGRFMSDERNAVFLSRDKRIYSVVEGDTLEDVYRIERLGDENLEILYLPEQRKMAFAFTALVEKLTPQAASVLPRDGALPPQVIQAYALPADAAGEASSLDNDRMDEELKFMLAPPPSEEDIAKSMGAATSPQQRDALQMMDALPAQGD